MVHVSSFSDPPPCFWYIFYFIFNADLASMSHDQDFKHNLFFSHWKVPQYLEKFTKHHFLISGGNFLSPRDLEGHTPPINGKKKFMCLFCVSECPDHFWFWQKKRWNKMGFWPPPFWNMFHLFFYMIRSLTNTFYTFLFLCYFFFMRAFTVFNLQ